MSSKCYVHDMYRLLTSLLLLALVTTYVYSQNRYTVREPLTSAPLFWAGIDSAHSATPFMSFTKRGLTWRTLQESTRVLYRRHSVDATQHWSITTTVTLDSNSNSHSVGLLVGRTDRRLMFYYRPSNHTFGVRVHMHVTNSWRTLNTKHKDTIYRPVLGLRPSMQTFNLTLERKGASIVFRLNGELLDSVTGSEVQPMLEGPALYLGLLVFGKGISTFTNVDISAATPVFAQNPLALRAVTRSFADEINLDTVKQSDRAPKVAPNGAAIYWVQSSRDSGDIIMVADRATDSTWKIGRPIGAPLNNKSSNSVIGAGQDNNSLVLWGRYKTDGSGSGAGLSRTKRTADSWEIPSNVDILGYKNFSKYREEAISPDGSVIIMSFQKDSLQKDQKDLYVSKRLPSGDYDVPIRIPEPVSSSFGELSPTIAADGRTLYFSSDRPGYGDADIWVCKRTDDTWLQWTTPQNMGPSVNTPGWDAFFTIHPSGKHAYMRSTDGQRSGIFRLTLPSGLADRPLLPDPTTIVSGTVTNGATGAAMGVSIKVVSLTGNYASTAVSEPKNGTYSIVLPAGTDYAFYADEQEFFPVSHTVRLVGSKAYGQVRQDLVLYPIKANSVIRLNNVFFETDKADLQVDSHEELLRLITMLKTRPTLRIELGGHTDDRASASHNLALSERRAKAVLDFLVSNAVEPKQLAAVGYGKSKPLAKGTSEEARQLNRRVEFKVLGE